MANDVAIGGDGTLFVGEDKTFELEVLDGDGLPVDVAGWDIVFDVRKTDHAPDPALFSKTATVSGTYDAVRATNTQRASVSLTSDETDTIKARTYRYSFKRLDHGDETVLAWGDFVVQKATAP